MKEVTEAKLSLVMMRILCCDFSQVNRQIFCEKISTVSPIFSEFANDLGKLAMEFTCLLNTSLVNRKRHATEFDEVLCTMVAEGFIGGEAGWDPRCDF